MNLLDYYIQYNQIGPTTAVSIGEAKTLVLAQSRRLIPQQYQPYAKVLEDSCSKVHIGILKKFILISQKELVIVAAIG